MVHVNDDSEASALVDLCVGHAVPAGGYVRFLGQDWAVQTQSQRLNRRRRIGVVAHTEVWPSQMTILEAVLLPRLYHSDRSEADFLAEATELARLFGLPGLPMERRDLISREMLVRAGCVRGFLGAPDLVLVHDQVLDRASDLAAPMAQAISATQRRGGAVLWIIAGVAWAAAHVVVPDQVFRLGAAGLVKMRRSP